MPSAYALGINSGKIIYNFAFVAACGPLQTHFHKRGLESRRTPTREKVDWENPQIFPIDKF